MLVPPDVVPWKKIVPPVPPDAVIVSWSQNVPPPDTVTTVGNAFTLTACVILQVVGNVYVIVGTPADTPVNVVGLLVEPTVARAIELLVHVPPVVTSANDIVEPTHTSNDGAVVVITAGNGFTVIVLVTKHPRLVV